MLPTLHVRFEQMRMIGWADSLFAKGPDSEHPNHSVQDSFEHIELLDNMAGNAWSVYHYAPIKVRGLTQTFPKRSPSPALSTTHSLPAVPCLTPRWPPRRPSPPTSLSPAFLPHPFLLSPLPSPGPPLHPLAKPHKHLLLLFVNYASVWEIISSQIMLL